MNTSKLNFLHDIYRLAYIKRYSNIPKIHEESVAEHGFFVAAIVMDLHDRYKFDLGCALAIAVAHDMPEMELNDAPWILKEKYPKIKQAFDECEREVAEMLPTACRAGVLAYDRNDSIETRIVHLADAMQCIQFAKVEVDLGNKGYMEKVYINSIDRVNKIQLEIEEHERA